MATDVKTRVALITGSTAADGIGYGIAKTLARNGYSIILHGRREASEVEPLREQIEKENGVAVHYLKADLMKRSEIESLCQQIKTIYSTGVDVLVNNAGVGYFACIEKCDPVKVDEVIQIHFTAPFDLIRLTLTDMKKKGWGRIINISSAVIHKLKPIHAGYGSSKWALSGLTKAVAVDSLGTGVTCNVVCPSMVETKLAVEGLKSCAADANSTYEEQKKLYMGQYNPSGEFVTVDQIAEVVAFLCTSAADQMTGAEIPLDAGAWSA